MDELREKLERVLDEHEREPNRERGKLLEQLMQALQRAGAGDDEPAMNGPCVA